MDSTSYGHDGYDFITDTGQDGQVNGGQEFDGTDDYIDLGHHDDLEAFNQLTVSVWINLDSFGTYRAFVGDESIGSDGGYHLYAYDSKLYWGIENSTPVGNYLRIDPYAGGSWDHVVATFDGSTSNQILYLNGSMATNEAVVGGPTRDGNNPIYIGKMQEWLAGRVMDGLMDEVRIMDTVASADWIATEYNNQSAPESFMTSETQAFPGDWHDSRWAFRQKITIHSSQVSGTGALTNFPVLITHSNVAAGLWAHAQDNGDDILFTQADAVTKLSHEIEEYDTNTDHMAIWVRIPQLSGLTDTDIYMYYGYPSAANQENPTHVWITDYMGVWHLEEDAAGTNNSTPVYMDSTSYGHDGYDLITDTGQDGQVNGGQEFDGTDDYIDLGHHDDLEGFSQLTVSMWARLDAFDTDGLIGDWSTGGGGYLMYANFGKLSWLIQTAEGSKSAVVDPYAAGSWDHIVGTFDGATSNQVLYVNGSQVTNEVAVGGQTTDNSRPVLIGGYYTYLTPLRVVDGSMDEVRIMNTVASADWIATEYNNQSAPQSFATSGGEEQPPGTVIMIH